MTHVRCAVWAVAGAILGFALVVWGQEPGSNTGAGAVDPSIPVLIELIKGGGLPTVLALLGWLASKGGIPVVIRLSDEDRRAIRKLRPKADPDDSEGNDT